MNDPTGPSPHDPGENRAAPAAVPGTVTVLIAAVAFGTIVRVGTAASGGLWLDEFQTWWLCSGESAASVFERCRAQMTQFPLFYLVARFSVSLLGKSEWALRLPALLCGIGSIAAVFVLGRRLLGARAGAAAAVCLAVAVPQIEFGVWARPYSMMVLLALLSTIFYLRWIDRRDRVSLLLYVASSVLMAWTHLLSLPLLLVHLIHLLAVGQRRGSVLHFVCALAVVGVLVIPLAGEILNLYEQNDAFTFFVPRDRIAVSLRFVETYLDSDLLLVIVPVLLLLGSSGLLGKRGAAPGGARSAGVRWSAILLLALWIALSIGLPLLALDLAGVSVFSSTRYFALLSIPFCLLVGWIVALAAGARRRAWIAPLVFGLLALILSRVPVATQESPFQWPFSRDWAAGLEQGVGARIFRPEPLEDWRSAVADLNRQANDGETVFVFTGYVESNQASFVRDPVLKDYLAGPLTDFYLERKLDVVILPADPFSRDHQQAWREALAGQNEPFWMLGRQWPGFAEAVSFFVKQPPGRARVAPIEGRQEGYDGDLVLLRCSVGSPGTDGGQR